MESPQSTAVHVQPQITSSHTVLNIDSDPVPAQSYSPLKFKSASERTKSPVRYCCCCPVASGAWVIPFFLIVSGIASFEKACVELYRVQWLSLSHQLILRSPRLHWFSASTLRMSKSLSSSSLHPMSGSFIRLSTPCTFSLVLVPALLCGVCQSIDVYRLSSGSIGS